MRKTQWITIVVAIILFGTNTSAYADAIDILAYVTRVNMENRSILSIFALVLCLAVINYAMNCLFIGIPAIKWCKANPKQVFLGLIILTILGQLADRIGAYIAIFLAVPTAHILKLQGEGSWVIPLIAYNFIFSGLSISFIVYYFLSKRWGTSGKCNWLIPIFAAIVTNPAWGYYFGLV
jgi:hypothetical protein